MSDSSRKEFASYVRDIITNDKFSSLDHELHHGITRFEHSMRVAKHTFMLTKFFGLKNVKDVTRAALLHDFFTDADIGPMSSTKKLGVHPAIALKNSLKYYDLNDLQKDIIINHMFPVTKALPKYKESWLVTMVDKSVSAYEMVKYKLPLYAGIYFLFMMNLFTVKV